MLLAKSENLAVLYIDADDPISMWAVVIGPTEDEYTRFVISIKKVDEPDEVMIKLPIDKALEMAKQMLDKIPEEVVD